ncbi:hypothetical protein BKA70DRAFT_1257046 [Coprinopsis sp. MPI-PUGE-AT-0042]|nr:hypothetical protein BKA70DRAFT_1257046 [Coprinopsis sp. MPI-PUGE-AT-0042]
MAANTFSPQAPASHALKRDSEPPSYMALFSDSGSSAHAGVLNAAQGPPLPLPGHTTAQTPHVGRGWAVEPHHSPSLPQLHPYSPPLTPSSQHPLPPYPYHANQYGPPTPLSHQQVLLPYYIPTDLATADALARSRFTEAVLCALGIYFGILLLMGPEVLEDWGLFLLRCIGVEAVVRAPI